MPDQKFKVVTKAHFDMRDEGAWTNWYTCPGCLRPKALEDSYRFCPLLWRRS